MVRLVGVCLLLVPASALASQCFATWMRRASVGQCIREEGPPHHRTKGGTPTLGGGIVLLIWALCFPLLHRLGQLSLDGIFVLTCGLCFGAVGLLDDLLSLRHRRSLGLSPLQKIALVSGVSAVLYFTFPHVGRTPLEVPFASVTVSLPPIGFFLVSWAVYLWTTNSMNLTDGLDGLAAGTAILILCGFLVVAPGRESAGAVLPLVAILVGFLWVNTYPARLFLGDVGSFALGGVVAALALVTGSALILPLLAGLLLLESGSVVLQVACFRLTGTRIFMISPLHHHFESGEGVTHKYLLPAVRWPEPTITLRLWIVQALFVGLGIVAARLY